MCIYILDIYVYIHFCILHIETCMLHTIYINLVTYIRQADCWQVVSGLPLARSETAICSPIMAPVWKADYKSPWRIAPMAKMVLKHFQIQTLSLGQQLFCILDRSCGSNGVEVGLAFCGSETAWVKHTVLRCTMLPHFDMIRKADGFVHCHWSKDWEMDSFWESREKKSELGLCQPNMG